VLEHVIPGGRGPSPGTVAGPDAIPSTSRPSRLIAMPLEHGCASVAAAKPSEGFVVGRFLDAPRQGCKRSVRLATLRSIACQASAREFEMNDRANRKHLILRRLLNAPA
jgi:hypothetical protein